jgi:hypothetical protein
MSVQSYMSMTLQKAPMDRDEIDQILRRKRKSTEKACYPCHRRKVRCNHGQPCSTCQRRGHPEICSYSFSETKHREKCRRPVVRTVTNDSAVSRRDDSEEPVNNSLLTPSLDPTDTHSIWCRELAQLCK